MPYWTALGRVLSASQGRSYFISAQHWCWAYLEFRVQSYAPQYKRRIGSGESKRVEWVKKKVPKMMKGLEHLTCEEKDGTIHFGEERAQGSYWCVLICNGKEILAVVASDRTGGNEYKLKCREFHLNIWKIFSVWVAKHWNMLPRDVTEIPSVGAVKTQLGMSPGLPAVTDSSWAKELNQTVSRDAVPNSFILQSFDSPSQL